MLHKRACYCYVEVIRAPAMSASPHACLRLCCHVAARQSRVVVRVRHVQRRRRSCSRLSCTARACHAVGNACHAKTARNFTATRTVHVTSHATNCHVSR